MQYGYFDDLNREYVITRPDTPSPWVNYLGDTEYGAIISNNAGGYSFEKSGANGRILRYYFNAFDEPGRYIYLKDEENDIWSASWGPVKKDLKTIDYECRHGLAYTIMKSHYKHFDTEVAYYVPLNKRYEVYALDVTNNDDKDHQLTVTGYVEFTNETNYEQDQVNLQYSLFISRTSFKDNRIIQKVKGNFDVSNSSEVDERFFGLVGNEVDSWCGDKKAFLGPYKGYANPDGVKDGHLSNTGNYSENSCGALSTVIELKAHEKRRLIFILGQRKDAEASLIMNEYKDLNKPDSDLKELKDYWSSKLSHFKIETPDKDFDTMINTWHAFNCFMTFTWSRAASLIYCGLRNGYGYRDTVQDIQGVIHLDPVSAKEKLSFMLSGQVDNGAGLPLVKFTHNPGFEDTPDDDSYVRETGHPAYRADDALWLFPTVYKYIAETGDIDYLDEVIPFANKDQGTVYEHLQRAIDFSLKHLGPHNLPAGLYADWNDCLRLGKRGESTFVAFQFYYALKLMKEFALYRKDNDYVDFITQTMVLYRPLLEQCFNEDRFIRGYTESGLRIGDRNNKEANMWLNPQSWAVISGFADKTRAELIMNNVYERLNTEYGAILMDPPFHEEPFDGALMTIFNAGNKENSGIFLQSQGWLILAEALIGHGNRAFEYYKESCPAAQNDQAEIREMEPYCYGQFTEGKHSPNLGRSHVHWLTGTASTVMVACVEGILGIRPDFYGLKISPSIPAHFTSLKIEKDFRNKHLSITIYNPDYKESGVKYIIINGEHIEGDYLKEDLLIDYNTIDVYL